MARPLSALRATHSWRDSLLGWRNRLLANPRFQQLSSAFPLTRPIARRHARAAFDLCAGFVYSQVLFACVQVRMFEHLAERPLSPSAIAQRVSLPLAATQRLLDAAASLKLVQRAHDGRYGLGVVGAALRGNPGALAMIEHHALLYADLSDPIALLRGENAKTQLQQFWGYAANDDAASLDDQDVAAYSRLMASSQAFIAREIVSAYALQPHRHLLDVGGGEGAFISAAASRAPALRFTLFDLPAVARRAESHFAVAGLADRASAVGGDFRSDRLPSGADIISLVRVLHDHDDAPALALLRAAHAALPKGGTLLVAEPLASTPGAEPMGDAYFGFYLLAMGSGRPRTPDRLQAMLQEAGFAGIKFLTTNTPLLTRVIVAIA